ncbi:hypothetical protein SISSUDRAFT_1104043, partial [Sistotremastrum suecicum HHB10207 ss-3]
MSMTKTTQMTKNTPKTRKHRLTLLKILRAIKTVSGGLRQCCAEIQVTEVVRTGKVYVTKEMGLGNAVQHSILWKDALRLGNASSTQNSSWENMIFSERNGTATYCGWRRVDEPMIIMPTAIYDDTHRPTLLYMEEVFVRRLLRSNREFGGVFKHNPELYVVPEFDIAKHLVQEPGEMEPSEDNILPEGELQPFDGQFESPEHSEPSSNKRKQDDSRMPAPYSLDPRKAWAKPPPPDSNQIRKRNKKDQALHTTRELMHIAQAEKVLQEEFDIGTSRRTQSGYLGINSMPKVASERLPKFMDEFPDYEVCEIEEKDTTVLMDQEKRVFALRTVIPTSAKVDAYLCE